LASTDSKAQFVKAAAAAASSHQVAADVGANAGLFTRILSEQFVQVLGIDNDQGAVDQLYSSTRLAGITNLTPLVVDITNPTPAFGWRGKERTSFVDRIQPDFATWLAVIHHLALGVGLPLQEIVSLVYEFSDEAVVEFVSMNDPMAQRISASRTGDLNPYSRDLFERYLAAAGTVVTEHEVSATRTMYHVKRA
jgi:ribosomal protein L11 methylase PrmA